MERKQSEQTHVRGMLFVVSADSIAAESTAAARGSWFDFIPVLFPAYCCILGAASRRSSPSEATEGGEGERFLVKNTAMKAILLYNCSTPTFLFVSSLLLTPPPLPRSRDVLRAAQGLRAAEAAPRGGGHDEGDEGEGRGT